MWPALELMVNHMLNVCLQFLFHMEFVIHFCLSGVCEPTRFFVVVWGLRQLGLDHHVLTVRLYLCQLGSDRHIVTVSALVLGASIGAHCCPQGCCVLVVAFPHGLCLPFLPITGL